MAFPIPDHLPRRAAPQDVSSSILTRIDSANNQTLNAELARSWLAELDNHIRSTKQKIRDRIRTDLPKFEGLLESTKSVRQRLQALETDVDALYETVSDSEKTGLISRTTRRLEEHSKLAQETANANVCYRTLLHLSNCQRQYANMDSLVQGGKLTEAVRAGRDLNALFSTAPTALTQAKIMGDFKRKLRVVESFIQEQLNEACLRSVILSHHEILVSPSVQVRKSETVLSLSSILSALSDESLAGHLSTIRRDLAANFIDHVLKEPCSVTAETDIAGRGRLSHIPLPPNTEDLSLRLTNLSTIFDFLSAHLFLHIPTPHWTSFAHSLCKLLTNSTLDNLLRPLLPSVFQQLSPYLTLVQQAVEFEEKYIARMLGGDPNTRAIQSWADNLGGHYERQRRVQILDLSRTVILMPGRPGDCFLEEIELAPDAIQSPVMLAEGPGSKDEAEGSNFTPDDRGDAWGFEEDSQKSRSGASTTIDEDSWGFDDGPVETGIEPGEPEEQPKPNPGDAETDPGDAWGWNEDNDVTIDDSGEDSAWDDPWAETSGSEKFEESYSQARAQPSQAVYQHKVASKLEKLAAKNKKQNGDTRSPALPSTSTAESPSKPPEAISRLAKTSKSGGPKIAHGEPLHPKTSKVIKEYYMVSGRTRRLVNLAEDAISEGKHMSTSNLLAPLPSGSPPGTTILQAALSTLDLFRALYPVQFAKELELPERAMTFSNDCLYLSGQVERIANGPVLDLGLLKDRFEECRSHFQILGESWYSDTIDQEKKNVNDMLADGSQDFVDSAEQDRYDECESTVNQVLKKIRHLANKWKALLPKSKYYSALGSITEAALSKIIDAILVLPDIPEVESHRLSELCRILNSLEGLFVEDPSQPSFVLAYVPSWLKFSYLSELLEASMADITYLFEAGALVDFSDDELVRLVRALFADTNLRTNTINKILAGHPTITG